MKRFKQLLTEITMNNPGVMFLLEGSGHYALNLKSGAGIPARHLAHFGIYDVPKFTLATKHELETPLTFKIHPDHKSRGGEDFQIKEIKMGSPSRYGHPLIAVGSDGTEVPLNMIQKNTKAENEGHLHELRISRILKHYGIARRDSIAAGSSDRADVESERRQPRETPTEQTNQTQYGPFRTTNFESGNPNHQFTVKTKHAFEVKKDKNVVFYQRTLKYNHDRSKWVIPETSDSKFDVPDRQLKDPKFGHPNFPELSLLDAINSGISNPGFLNTNGIYGSNISHQRIYATPQMSAGKQKLTKSGKPLFQEIPQHDSLPSTDLDQAQEHLAKKSDFLIIGTQLYTLNPEIHEALKSRNIPSIMLSHSDNKKEGTFNLHTRVKNSESGNVNVSMRLNKDLHDGVPMNHDHMVALSNRFFNEGSTIKHDDRFDILMKSIR
jgi:hypothetical protein